MTDLNSNPSRQLNRTATPLELIASRRSCLVKHIGAPGLTPEHLMMVLEAAIRVPDHGNLAPWRFIVIDGEARRELPSQLVAIAAAEATELTPKQARLLKRFGEDAPSVIAVLFRCDKETDVPEWEQQLSVGAACQNMLIAATALGYVGQWLTSAPAYSANFPELLGGQRGDKLAGFLFFGTQAGPVRERVRPQLSDVAWRMTDFGRGGEPL